MTLQKPIFKKKNFKKIFSLYRFSPISIEFWRPTIPLISKNLICFNKFLRPVSRAKGKRKKVRLWRLINFKQNTLYISIFYRNYFYYSSVNPESLNVLPLTVSEKKNTNKKSESWFADDADAGRTFSPRRRSI